MKLKEVFHIIESVAPLSWQEPWDNSGLQVDGREAIEVSRILLCTDVTPGIVDEAIAKECHLILSHHPLLFHPLRHIIGSTWQEEVVIRALRHGIAIYSSHTPMDQYIDGISGAMADRLQLTDRCILHPTHAENVGYGIVGTRDGERIAVCGGAGADFLDDAIRLGAARYLTAEWKHHQLLDAQWAGIIPVEIGHWQGEQVIKDVYRRILSDTKLTLIDAEADIAPTKELINILT